MKDPLICATPCSEESFFCVTKCELILNKGITTFDIGLL